uniref:Putative phosphoadenosine phosphosulfate n=1 Tax=viral metagenome TaxID=1070528 RepID=A0A6M3XP17_9ZZZZ
MKHIVSYGGGVNSTAMVIWMLQHGQPIDHIVFCDTGAELPETLEYVNTFGHWLKQHGLSIQTIGREEGLFDYCTRLRIIPFRQFRWCTDKFKVRPFNKFAKEHLPVIAYIGFDAGEESRVLNSETPFVGRKCKQKKYLYGRKYPLFQNGIDRYGCLDLIRQAGLPDPPKSGCFFCPFMSPKQYQHMKNERPELFKKAMELEQSNISGKLILETVSLTDIFNQQEMQLCSYEIELPCGCHDGN